MQAWLRPSPVARYILGSDLEMVSTDMLAPEKPKDWQTQLQAMIREASHLIADAAVPGYLQLSQLGGRCNSTYLVSGWGVSRIAGCMAAAAEVVAPHSCFPHNTKCLATATAATFAAAQNAQPVSHFHHKTVTSLLLLPSPFSPHTPLQVVEGGIMGRGTVNSSTMGMVVLPSPFAFESPYLVRGTFDSSWWRRRARSVVIALIVLVSVLGALLMACLALLAYRLCKAAGKRRGPIVGALPYANDGVAHIPTTQVDVGLTGASAIENGARRHQHAGGVHAGGL